MKESDTLRLMKSHRSIRKFTDEEIPKEQIKDLIRAGQSAATSHFVQAYSVILVNDREKRVQIAEVSKQEQVIEAPVFLLFCADLKRLEYAAQKHGTDFKYDTVENFVVANVDTALVAQNVLLAAESLGFGGCYVGGIRNNLEIVSEAIGLPDKVIPLFGMTLGVPAISPEIKPRLPVDTVLHEDSYDENKYESHLEAFDQELKQYYATRSQNKKEISWTKLMADFFANERRSYLRKFIENKGFHLS